MRQKAKTLFRNPFVQLGFFIMLLLAGRTVWYMHSTPPEHPHAVHGVLDLRGWDFEQSRIIPLEGEWSFYPDKLVGEDDLSDGSAGPPRELQAPGDWREAWTDAGRDSYGYGTYRLRILVDGTLTQPYEFWFDNVQASSKVIVNGKEEAPFGVPGDRKQNYKPDVRSYTVTYYPSGGEREIDLLVQVANYDNPTDGGMMSPVKFGSQAAIDRERWYSIGFQLVTFVVFMLHGLYALIIFAINPRQKAALAVFLLLFCAGMTVIDTSDRLLLQWAPLTYTARMKVSLLSYLYVSFLILAVAMKLVDADRRGRLFRIYSAVLGLYTVFLLGVSARTAFHWYHVFGILYLLPIGATLVLFVQKVRRNSQDVLLLMAAVSIVFSVVGGALQRWLPTEFYPLDMIAALISVSAYWFKNYFRNAEENVRLSERLKRNDRLKDEFLAHTAHELRTPLHGVISIAQTVLGQERQALQPRNADNMELLLTVGRRMSQLINDLLDMSRLQEKRIVLQPERLSLQAAASGVFSMLAYLADAKGLKLRMDVADSFPPVRADEKRLVQILFNLLHNAIKYTDSGEIALSAETEGGMAVVHVADTGIGMDGQTQERVFLSYEQGTHGVGGGIGLGLAICKQLTELHGGRLSVRSEPGRGSVFTFTVPLDSAASEAADSAASEAAAQALRETAAAKEPIAGDSVAGEATGQDARRLARPVGRPPIRVPAGEMPASWPGWQPPEKARARGAGVPNVLIVDDDPINLKVLAGILPAEQYRVVPALSGAEALARLEGAAWDLAIIDVMMPHMSGYELTREIRKQWTMSELPILLLTARTQPEDIYAGFMAGANDYVAKPADALELQYRVWSLTALKASVQESLRMEAAYLQAQIKPHFLFNTLNSLMALSDLDAARMRKLGDAFTSFLRISFDFLNVQTMVPLAHELELVRAYLYIEQERFGSRLQVVWEVEEHDDLWLPPLTVQPLVENAVRHGLLSRARGGTLRIRLVRADGCYRFEVEDDGKGMDERTLRELLADDRKSGGGIGLRNTDRRLRQAYGEGLSVRSEEGRGTVVSFAIPDQGHVNAAGRGDAR